VLSYSVVRGFCLLEEMVEWCKDCEEVARGGCLVAADISVKNLTVQTEGQRRARPNVTRHCVGEAPISRHLKIRPTTNDSLYYNRGDVHLKIYIQHQQQQN